MSLYIDRADRGQPFPTELGQLYKFKSPRTFALIPLTFLPYHGNRKTIIHQQAK